MLEDNHETPSFCQWLPSTRNLFHRPLPLDRLGKTCKKRHNFLSDYLQPEIYLIVALLLVDAGGQGGAVEVEPIRQAVVLWQEKMYRNYLRQSWLRRRTCRGGQCPDSNSTEVWARHACKGQDNRPNGQGVTNYKTVSFFITICNDQTVGTRDVFRADSE